MKPKAPCLHRPIRAHPLTAQSITLSNCTIENSSVTKPLIEIMNQSIESN
ncbi:hypothetical protein Hdeb2414_s0008g00285381 [Helianthus debilis subsp. tardiflorus]